jgi:ATP-dependent helicase/nuclease subunit A
MSEEDVYRPADQPARDRIREELDATLFVEAGAGTGKTTELVERILRLVATGRAQMPHLAAITFTEAAAAELRDRVREELEKAARDESLPPDERERCRVALEEVDAAAIETLHGFAQRILSAHPLEAGLPPLIEVQDEIRSSIAFEERWSEFVDRLLDDAALEEALLRAHILGLETKQLREVAREFHRHWDRLEDATIEAAPLPPLDVSPLLDALAEPCALMERCANPEDWLYRHLERMDTYHRRLAAAGSDLDTLRIMAERTKIANKYGNKDNWSGIAPAEIRDALQAASGVRDRLLQEARAAVLPPLLAALRGFILQYAEERRRQGRLEFHDLLVQARDLLRRDASVRRALKAQLSHLLIDEFQDTDPLQIEIAVLLAGSDSDSPPPAWQEAAVEEGRLFFVGDPKQSIYRFRRADIALYQAVQRRFADRTVRLTQNFRSLRPVIDWVNAVFAPLLGEGAADGQAPYTELAARWEPPAEAGVTVHVLGEPTAENIEPVRAREAAELAQLIQAAKGEGWPVADKESDGRRVFRPARYADIAILMPTRTALPPVEQALEEAGIPYRVESRSLVYNTQEVRDLLTILRSLDDPTDEVALIAALRSPAFGCGDDDLLRFSQAGGRWDYRVDPPASLPPDDPVVAAMAALHDLHKRRWWESINGIVEAVIRERRLFELAFAHRRPRERWQRLRFLLDQARAFAEEGGATLRQFIDWAELQAEEGTRVVETVVPEADDDAVRIMTIHASKGLEFPIVALVGLNVAGRSGRQGSTQVLWDRDSRPEVRIGAGDARFQSPGFERLAAVEETMDEQEKLRLLYVAVTRARDHLVVSLHHKVGQTCHAARLHERCQETPHLWRAATMGPAQPAAPPQESTAPFADGPEQRRGWLDARERRLKALSRAPVIAATAIARSTAGPTDDPNLQKEAPIEEIPPWRRGRAGTALGRAVHAVLQSIDLASGAGVEGAARAQAAAEGIPDRSGEVARLVRAALNAPSVREAVGGRYWREVYVAAPVDGMTVEGFIDLLYETGEGLVIVDYKTDAVPGEEELEAALARYRLQGAAYALALQEALGRPVAGCRFVFAQAGDDRERELPDLPAAIEAVRAVIRRLSATGGGGV